MVTDVPIGPCAGENPAITGPAVGVTMNGPGENAARLIPEYTAIGPVVASGGTMASISVGETDTIGALRPLKVTSVVVTVARGSKNPESVTTVPGVPVVGVNPVIVGTASTVNVT